MSDVILVVLSRPETVTNLLNAAGRLVALLGGAHLNVLALREPAELSVLEAEALMPVDGTIVTASQAEKERVGALTAAFHHWAPEAGRTADAVRWIEAEGNAMAVIGAGQPRRRERGRSTRGE